MRAFARLAAVCVLTCAAATPALAQPADGSSPAEAEQAVAIENGLQELFTAPLPQQGPDVFGYASVEIGATRLEEQWRQAADTAPSLTGPWADLVDRIRTGSVLSRAQSVNSFTNHHIAFSDDPSIYGVADHWAGLLETIARGRGDCEDFAIAKMQLLAAAGIPSQDLYVILVRDEHRDIDHAVLAVRDGEELYILDSANDRVRASDQVNGYRPVVSFSGDARWTFGRRTAAAPGATSIDSQPSAEAPTDAYAPSPIDLSTPPFR